MSINYNNAGQRDQLFLLWLLNILFIKVKRKRKLKDFVGYNYNKYIDKTARTLINPVLNQYFIDRLKSNIILFPTPSLLDYMSISNKMAF